MWSYNYTDELYHYGVKGMRWGVRRYEDKSGHLTSAGKKRYDDYTYNVTKKRKVKAPSATINKPKSAHRQKLEEKYQNSGMTKSQAEQAAAKRIRAEKFVAGTAAVAVTAGLIYGAHKYKKYTTDTILNMDTEFQTILDVNKGENVKLRDQQYATYLNKDKAKFERYFSSNIENTNRWSFRTDDREVVSAISKNVKGQTKVASQKVSRDEFVKLYKTNKEFRDGVNTQIKNETDASGLNKVFKGKKRGNTFSKAAKSIKDGKMDDKVLRKHGYDAFNIGLVSSDEKTGSTAKIFYDKLKEKGYHAIEDVNDQKYSTNIRGKMPIIIFDKDSFTTQTKRYTKEQLDNFIKDNDKIIGRKELISKGKEALSDFYMDNEGSVLGATSLTGMAAIRSASMKKRVNDYKRKHPNTTMSDKEIQKMISEELKKQKKK